MRVDGARALLMSLLEEKVEVVFGYPGGSVITLYDVLPEFPIRHVLVRHEQGAAHAADAYARVSGKVGVCFATSGPGATNLVTGLANAMMDSIPIIAVTGQVAVGSLGTDAFQEADLTGITLPVTKHSYLVKKASDIPRVVKEAFHIAATGRPGPVLIDLPKDVQLAQCEFHYPKAVDLPGYKPNYDAHPQQLQRAARAIAASPRPVILAGGGVIASGASDVLTALARKASIPVVPTLMGLGAFPAGDPLFLGIAGMHGSYVASRALHEADLLIAVGTRFSDRVTGPPKGFAPRARVIHIDIDPAEIGKNVRVTLPIVADARRALEPLLELVPEGGVARRPWLKELDDWKAEAVRLVERNVARGRRGAVTGTADLAAGDRPSGQSAFEKAARRRTLSPLEVMDRLGAWTRDHEAIVVTDVGQHQMWAAQRVPVDHPRAFVTSGGLGTMGFGLPAALGAKVARPDKPVVLVTGDGSFQMQLQQLATIRSENLDVKVVIFNNGYLGMVRQWQDLFNDKRYSAVALGQWPDFCKLGEAYGLRAARATSTASLKKYLTETLECEGPALLECMVEPEANVFPIVPPGQGFEQVILS